MTARFDDSALTEVLGALVAEARLQTALLERIAAVLCPAGTDAGARRLLEVIHGWCGTADFTAGDLVDHANFEPAVRGALEDACGALSARRLGKLLRRLEGLDFGGLSVRRERVTREGITWRVASLRV